MRLVQLFILFFFISCINVSGQTSIDLILTEIRNNNKTLQTTVQLWEAQKLKYQTGNSIYDPFIELDYLQGSPSGAGNETDLSVIQSFDFPSAYIKKKKVSEAQIAKADYYINEVRQNILLEAKLICLELIYLNKFNIHLEKRKNDTGKWVQNFETLLSSGGGNILDVNKARLQLIEIKKEYQSNRSKIEQLNQRLTQLNGGIQINLTDTIYPEITIVENFTELTEKITENDPARKYLLQEVEIAKKQVGLQKALWLPKFETGYRYKTLLNETFNGIHLGLTIPLWENKNTVKSARAMVNYSESNLQQHLNDRFYETKQEYESYTNLLTSLTEYQNLFNSMNSIELLNKSFQYGEISSMEYFVEVGFYYQALQNFLKTENEYYQSIARLYSYQLID